MTVVQRLTLMIMLVIDVLLILHPPFHVRSQFGHVDIGYHWLLSSFHGAQARIDFVILAAEIVIVSVIGFTVFILARAISDERAAAFGRALQARVDACLRLPAPRNSPQRVGRSILSFGNIAIAVALLLIVAVLVVFRLAQIGVL